MQTKCGQEVSKIHFSEKGLTKAVGASIDKTTADLVNGDLGPGQLGSGLRNTSRIRSPRLNFLLLVGLIIWPNMGTYQSRVF